MQFWEIAVADSGYHGNEALTYSSEAPLQAGQIVYVPLRRKRILGIVLRQATAAPTFAVKPVADILPLPPLPLSSLRLMIWLREYYPAPYGIITQLFLPGSFPKTIKIPTTSSDNISPMPKDERLADLPPLTPEQAEILAQIPPSGSCILHGDTGSGKTRVYIELAAKCLDSGRSAIILTPEIGLTAQLAGDFIAAFGKRRVLTVHSQLTPSSRRQLWLAMLLAEEPLVVVGPRSALFSPLKDIGLVVIDEAHEPAYKQDQSPYYHANRVAAALGNIHRPQVIFGSATPPITDYFLAAQRGRPILRMTQNARQTAGTSSSRTIATVDLRDRTKFSKSPYLSQDLIAAIKDRLASGEQSLLFLNRRGTARIVFCETCGWQAACPHCDTPLVYHGDTHQMRCHSCSFSAESPASCPDCHSATVVFRSIGTKALVSEVSRLFPDARVQRFDTDNAPGERMERQFEDIRSGSADILIGTQTLAKGLDLPKLTLVGVVVADSSLSFPDFSAAERTYQLLRQVIGRVGRGHRPGTILLQTYDPASPLLQQIIANDWDGFYAKELADRQAFLFPPFSYLLKLTCRRARNAAAETAARELADRLKREQRHIIVEGPTPAFHERLQGKYQWQIIVKAKARPRLTAIIQSLPSGWSYDIDPMNLL